MATASANRWNLETNGDLTAEPILPVDPVNLAPVDVPTRLTARGTLPAPPAPAVPTGLSAMAISDRSVQLYWDGVLGQTSYNIYTGGGSGTLVGTVQGAHHNYTLSGLAAETAYSIRVTSVGVGGESAKSAALAITTLAAQTVPAIPPNSAPGLVEITSVSGQTINLKWNPVTSTPAVTQYKVYNGAVLTNTITAPTLTAAVALVPRSNYSLTVRATNSAGEGPPQLLALTGTVPAATTVPATITGLALNTAVTTTTIPLTWTADGKAETYKVYDGVTLKATVTAPATSVTLTGYTTGTSYSITVKGSNSVGDSASASTALTGTTAAVPAAPTGLALNTVATTTTIPIIWSAVSGAVPAVTSYKVYDGVTLKATITAPAVSTTLTGYTTGTAYSITVKATNAVGDSAASTALTGSTA